MYPPGIERFFERRPLWGVVFAVCFLCFVGWLNLWLWRQYRAFGNEPERVAFSQALPGAEDPEDVGRWVHLYGEVEFHCENMLLERRSSPVAEEISKTYIPVMDSGHSRFVLLSYRGQMSCRRAMEGRLEGVLLALKAPPPERTQQERPGRAFRPASSAPHAGSGREPQSAAQV